ncbi:putative sugar O-methyltransferase [Poseidonibacter antarcticus]|uniref:putative sugar O-methyltransferase n=1 Tax=Poseidonibacter antarcticus TaxID=2478538 RepID=UPI000EF4BE31|nr:putative sugar O-methyltransferase [Poseidonibacter antarcticus]
MKKNYPLLNLMLEDMNKQNELYKPTTFWEYGSSLIIDELEKNDIKDFRNLTITRSFFVPGYSAVEYLANRAKFDVTIDEFDKNVTDKRFTTRLQRLFTGETSAFNDYRVLQASNIDKKPYIDAVSESNIGNPIEQVTFKGRNFSRSFLNYLLGLSFLKKTVDTSDIKTIMEIGGGFGTLGEILLKDKRNDVFYINADIPPVGFVSSYYLQEVFGKEKIANYQDTKDLENLDIEKLRNQYDALNICSWQVPKLKGKIDLFVNFISFQEMEPDIVQNYCKYIDKLEPKYILLRNILEGKRVQSKDYMAGVKEPILGDDYNIFLPNYELIKVDSGIFGFVTEDGFHSQLRLYKRA